MMRSMVLGHGRTALVTGASRGIGPLIARAIAGQGTRVILTGRSRSDLEAVSSELAAAGADVSFIVADLTEPGAAERVTEDIERRHGASTYLSTMPGVTRCANSTP
jgi:short-subunit dehydrogenase